MSDRIALPQVSAKLLELTGHPGPGYIQIYRMICSGRIPAEHRHGRYYILTENLPMIAEMLGLPVPRKAPVAVSAPRSRKAKRPDLLPAA